MKKLVVLGAGTAGTIVVNRLRPKLGDDWQITIVDQNETHLYQPGFLFIPFGMYDEQDVIRERRDFIPWGVELVISEIEGIDPDGQTVALSNGTKLEYDELIIATGTSPTPGRRRVSTVRRGGIPFTTSTPSKARSPCSSGSSGGMAGGSS